MKDYIEKIRNEEKNETSYIKRFIAYAIDWYIGSVLASLPLILLYMSLHKDATYIPSVLSIFDAPYNLIAGVMSFTVAILYYVVVPMYTHGVTLGKKICGLKIVSSSYQDASAKQLFIRQFIMILLVEGSIYTASNMLHQMVNIVSGYNFAHIYAYIGGAISIVSIALVILLKSKRSLHDLVANTLVVDIKSNQYSYQLKKAKKAQKKLKLS